MPKFSRSLSLSTILRLSIPRTITWCNVPGASSLGPHGISTPLIYPCCWSLISLDHLSIPYLFFLFISSLYSGLYTLSTTSPSELENGPSTLRLPIGFGAFSLKFLLAATPKPNLIFIRSSQENSERLLSLGKCVIRLMLALLPKLSIAVLIYAQSCFPYKNIDNFTYLHYR